jgi:hypothetical protein
MGFRCTFITDWPGPNLPPWFAEKWRNSVNFAPGDTFPLSSKERTKANWGGIVEDIQRVLQEGYDGQYDHPMILVFLHECSGVTRVEISRNQIVYSEPATWKRVNDAHGHYLADACDDRTYETNA